MQIMSFFLMLVATPDAEAKKKKNEGVEVTFIIMEQDTQEPISTASVLHPSDIESSRVNELNGTWQSSEVYLPDGSVILFTPGSLLEMEISAPGYVTQIVQYDIKKRRNKVPIYLEKMEIDDSDIEMPSIPFGWDKERDPSMGGAAN